MATVAEKIVTAISPEQLAQLDAQANAMTAQQLWWASGYLAGRAAALPQLQAQPAGEPAPLLPAAQQDPSARLTVLYASETGNSRRVAQQLADSARAHGAVVCIEDLARYKPRQLRHEKCVAIVVATHGLGDPPDGTEPFFDHWFDEKAPQLTSLQFSVLALGDSSYDDFCKVGRDLDSRLSQLGATRRTPRVDCDVDFESAAATWQQQVVSDLQPPKIAPAPTVVTPLRPVESTYDRSRPFPAEVLSQQKITARQSSKDVRHFELSLEGSGLTYMPGDSLGVIPKNPPPLVDAFLETTGYDGAASIHLDGRRVPLQQALEEHLEITVASWAFTDAFARVSNFEAPVRDAAGRSWLEQRQIIDIVTGQQAPQDPQQFVACLRRLTPRLYSIASSSDANPGEVHLTVRMVEYQAFGRHHWGAASTFLAAHDRVPVFIEPNERFRLPDDPDTPIVMIGPGTGVAPFRAFIEHRATHGATGKNWLFFGDRNQHNDFLYQIEWLRYRKQGLLNRLDVAFSRDQQSKVYVQDRVLEQGAELYDWLESGAHLYICGDAKNMAPAVHRALREVVTRNSACSVDDAEHYLRNLKTAGRYHRDVY